MKLRGCSIGAPRPRGTVHPQAFRRAVAAAEQRLRGTHPSSGEPSFRGTRERGSPLQSPRAGRIAPACRGPHLHEGSADGSANVRRPAHARASPRMRRVGAPRAQNHSQVIRRSSSAQVRGSDWLGRKVFRHCTAARALAPCVPAPHLCRVAAPERINRASVGWGSARTPHVGDQLVGRLQPVQKRRSHASARRKRGRHGSHVRGSGRALAHASMSGSCRPLSHASPSEGGIYPPVPLASHSCPVVG